jgi:hypothetical protein
MTARDRLNLWIAKRAQRLKQDIAAINALVKVRDAATLRALSPPFLRHSSPQYPIVRIYRKATEEFRDFALIPRASRSFRRGFGGGFFRHYTLLLGIPLFASTAKTLGSAVKAVAVSPLNRGANRSFWQWVRRMDFARETRGHTARAACGHTSSGGKERTTRSSASRTIGSICSRTQPRYPLRTARVDSQRI